MFYVQVNFFRNMHKNQNSWQRSFLNEMLDFTYSGKVQPKLKFLKGFLKTQLSEQFLAQSFSKNTASIQISVSD